LTIYLSLPLKVEDIIEGKVYYPRFDRLYIRYKFRRVIRILGDTVFFSTGGDKVYSCSMTTFRLNVTTRRPKK
jgi:hypothetical protein